MKTDRSQQPEFGRRVRQRREELGLSQRELAGELVTPSYISLLESGQRSPTLDLVLHLAEVIRLPLSELIGEAQAPDSAAAPAPAEYDGLDLVMARSAARSAAEMNDHNRAAELLATAYAAAVERSSTVRQLDLGLALQDELRSAGRQFDRLELLEHLADQEWVKSEPQLRIVLSTNLAAAQRDAGRLTDARESAYAALSEIGQTQLTGAFEHIQLLGVLISVLCEINDLGQVKPLLTDMLTLAEAHTAAVRSRAHWVASIAYSHLGMASEARGHLDLARAGLTAQNTSMRDWLRFMRSGGNVLLDDGDPAAALPWLEGAKQVSPMVDAPDETTRILALQARYELAAGAPENTVALYPRLTEDAAPLSGTDLVRANLVQAEALSALNRTEEALALLRETAVLCDDLTAYELAVRVWKRIDMLRS